VTVKLPKALLAGWKSLFAAAHRAGHPDASVRDRGEAWKRFLVALPAILLGQRVRDAREAVGGWLEEEFISAQCGAPGSGWVALYRPAPWGLITCWASQGGYLGPECDPSEN
jgi:hypothetical protein